MTESVLGGLTPDEEAHPESLRNPQPTRSSKSNYLIYDPASMTEKKAHQARKKTRKAGKAGPGGATDDEGGSGYLSSGSATSASGMERRRGTLGLGSSGGEGFLGGAGSHRRRPSLGSEDSDREWELAGYPSRGRTGPRAASGTRQRDASVQRVAELLRMGRIGQADDFYDGARDLTDDDDDDDGHHGHHRHRHRHRHQEGQGYNDPPHAGALGGPIGRKSSSAVDDEMLLLAASKRARQAAAAYVAGALKTQQGIDSSEMGGLLAIKEEDASEWSAAEPAPPQDQHPRPSSSSDLSTAQSGDGGKKERPKRDAVLRRQGEAYHHGSGQDGPFSPWQRPINAAGATSAGAAATPTRSMPAATGYPSTAARSVGPPGAGVGPARPRPPLPSTRRYLYLKPGINPVKERQERALFNKLPLKGHLDDLPTITRYSMNYWQGCDSDGMTQVLLDDDDDEDAVAAADKRVPRHEHEGEAVPMAEAGDGDRALLAEGAEGAMVVPGEPGTGRPVPAQTALPGQPHQDGPARKRPRLPMIRRVESPFPAAGGSLAAAAAELAQASDKILKGVAHVKEEVVSSCSGDEAAGDRLIMNRLRSWDHGASILTVGGTHAGVQGKKPAAGRNGGPGVAVPSGSGVANSEPTSEGRRQDRARKVAPAMEGPALAAYPPPEENLPSLHDKKRRLREIMEEYEGLLRWIQRAKGGTPVGSPGTELEFAL